MPLQPPASVLAILDKFDDRKDIFGARQVEWATIEEMRGLEPVPPEYEPGAWAELAAFAFRTRAVSNKGPWGTYFQPWLTNRTEDGSHRYHPDLSKASAETVSYWAERARSAKHPVLVARYADLVWDTTKFVTKAKRRRDGIDFARLAIDNYIAASRLDDGSALLDTRENLPRAFELAKCLVDEVRTSRVFAAIMNYADRVSDDEHLGSYYHVVDQLLLAKSRSRLTAEQERPLVERLETKFAAMIESRSRLCAEPHGPLPVGERLAAYYQREGKAEDRTRILRGIAETFERRAKIGDALAGVMFLDSARRTYHDAGLREEAERVQRDAQALGPEAVKCMAPITVEIKIKNEDEEKCLAGMMEGGLDEALERFAFHFVPRQRNIEEWLKRKDSQFVAHKLFPTTKMAHGHIVAHVEDDTGDPDGKKVHETADHMQYSAPWIGWTLTRMIREGFTTTHAMNFIRKTPIFEEDRLRLVERGIEAHLRGDYVQAVHVLLPQIEHAIRTLFYLIGKPSNKAHRTGRGVMQFKNLNDLLSKDEWPVPGEDGENLRMYLLATLAHPKGANIRNEVAHGLWPERAFHRRASERVLHVLLAVATIRFE